MFPGLKKVHVTKLNLFVSHHGRACVGIMAMYYWKLVLPERVMNKIINNIYRPLNIP